VFRPGAAHAFQQVGQRLRRHAGLAPGDGRGADAFDLGEECGGYLFGEHVADHRAKTAYIVAQRQISRREFGGTCLVHRLRGPWMCCRPQPNR